MRQNGVMNRLTAEQIGRVRDVHARLHQVKREKKALEVDFGLDKNHFSKIGTGALGKKPRP